MYILWNKADILKRIEQNDLFAYKADDHHHNDGSHTIRIIINSMQCKYYHHCHLMVDSSKQIERISVRRIV